MKYIYLLIKIWISQLQKKMPQWYSIYYIANMMAFYVLEMYQITYMYRSLTVFLIFCLYVASNKMMEAIVSFREKIFKLKIKRRCNNASRYLSLD